MSIRNLEFLFKPRSVALIGASEKPHSVGATVLRNLMAGGYQGQIYPVNLKYSTLAGLPVHARVADLPQAPDLALICTPAATVPGLIAELGERGAKAAIVLSAGLGAEHRPGLSIMQAMLDAARPYLLRILGPNCVGLLAPAIGLNASFAHTDSLPGRLAFVSQSGALVTGVLDWAKSRGIGFSKFISLGESADVDFGDLLDYLAGDAATSAILLYIEDIRHARKFMSAARSAARSKPVLVVKAGREAAGAKAAASHTGALAGADGVYDAAIRRAGMLRVLTTEELFDAVETLAHARPLSGPRLAILTNGGGPGVMATDALAAAGGSLAQLSDATRARLDAVLPATWSHGNPVDIIGDAPVQRYVQALEALLADPDIDAVLLLHAPTAIVSSSEIAQALVPMLRLAWRNVLTCWLGGDAVAAARQSFAQAGIPSYGTPEEAVRGFMQIVHYRANQDLLMQAPPSLGVQANVDRERARGLLRQALAAGQTMLSEPQAKDLLAAYGIPVTVTRIVADAEQAAQAAQEIGFPVALKLLSPDVTHKTEVGGVVLDLETPEAVRAAAAAIAARLQQFKPGARLQGYSVQQMARRPEGQELIVGIGTDPVFGPVVLFGQGGIAVEVMDDHALALPPLNMVLARDLVGRTRVARLLAAFRNRPPADLDAVCRVLIQVGRMAADLPELVELDINPLVADASGVIALDARARIAPPSRAGGERLAIRPYPQELEETIEWNGQTLLLRPIRPEDGAAHLNFFRDLDPEDVRYRAFIGLRELQRPQLARLTQIDYDREMAFIAARAVGEGVFETLGVARAAADPDNVDAEFAIIVRSDLKGKGLGVVLMNKLIGYCRQRGTRYLVGEAMTGNRRLIRLARSLGFQFEPQPDSQTLVMRLDLERQSKRPDPAAD